MEYICTIGRPCADSQTNPCPSGLTPDDGHLELSERVTQNGAVQIKSLLRPMVGGMCA